MQRRAVLPARSRHGAGTGKTGREVRWRTLTGRTGALHRLAASALMLGAASAQPPADEGAEPLPPPPTIFDLSWDVEDPDELLPPKSFQNRWRQIWGAVGMRAHYYPSQLSGPENWPPQLFAGGMNYSLWRDPVTGWREGTSP